MCDKIRDPRNLRQVIAGGRNAERKQFPHMALIGYGPDPTNADWVCGGTIITNKYILTAAHCISSPALGKIKYAALGILKRDDDQRMWHIYDIVQIIGHPDYQPPSKYHDIALLKTGKDIMFTDSVLPACLLKDPSKEATVAIATGWGTMGHRKPLAEILQMVEVVRFQDTDCRRAYPVHRHLANGYDPTTQICYGSVEEINDTCEGDSGGPLQMDARPGMQCMAIVFGVTSYGKACGYRGSSGMYTKVSHYIPWIESIVGRLPY
ncbi:serine protease snake-like [Spodoptera litura]|uniref:Serine protease snake-like n=1 Tax=Spodoptera litura TaxID=69820 RepID=A0A9J7DYW2_SPOLT|nr:serine protease snake-like [Spodoptera litura]